jgi:hypothetical protein
VFHHTHHHHYYDEAAREVLAGLAALKKSLDLANQRLEIIMATLADVTAAVARNTDAEDAALVYLKDIAQKLKDAIAANDPAALDKLVADIDANTAKAAAAIVQGT